jgi:hypothetical protein
MRTTIRLLLLALLAGAGTLLPPTAAHAATLRVTAWVLDAPRYGDTTVRLAVSSTGVSPWAQVRLGETVVARGEVSGDPFDPTVFTVALPGDGTDVGAAYLLRVSVEAEGELSGSTSAGTTRIQIPYVLETFPDTRVDYAGRVAVRVVPTRPTTVVPAGRVTLTGDVALTSDPLVAAPDGRGFVASVPVRARPGGTYHVRASYPADAAYPATTDVPAGDLIVHKVAGKVVAALSSDRIVTGTPVSLHVTVTAPGSPVPESELGSVFVDIFAQSGSGSPFQLGSMILPVGPDGSSYDLTRWATGRTGAYTFLTSTRDGRVVDSVSTPVTLTVDPPPATTTTTLGLDRTTTYVGQTPPGARVSVVVAGGVPRGAVELRTGDGRTVASAPATGVTTALDVPVLPEGEHQLTAVYVPAAGELGSSSAPRSYTVRRDDVRIEDDLPPDGEVEPGASVSLRLSATATARVPTGTLSWGGGELPLVDGAIRLPATGLGSGPHELVLTYSGDAFFLPATTTVRLTVRPPAATAVTTSTSVVVDRVEAVVGSPLAATVRTTAADGSTPSGPVEVRVDGTLLGTWPAAGARSVVLPTGAVGAHTVTARLAGSPEYRDSASSPVTYVVAQASATLTARARRARSGAAEVRVAVAAPVPVAGTVRVLLRLPRGRTRVVGTATLQYGAAVVRTKRLRPGRVTLLVEYVGSATVHAAQRRLTVR